MQVMIWVCLLSLFLWWVFSGLVFTCNLSRCSNLRVSSCSLWWLAESSEFVFCCSWWLLASLRAFALLSVWVWILLVVVFIFKSDAYFCTCASGTLVFCSCIFLGNFVFVMKIIFLFLCEHLVVPFRLSFRVMSCILVFSQMWCVNKCYFGCVLIIWSCVILVHFFASIVELVFVTCFVPFLLSLQVFEQVYHVALSKKWISLWSGNDAMFGGGNLCILLPQGFLGNKTRTSC